MVDTSRVGGTVPCEKDAGVLAALDLAWLLPGDELIACEVGVLNSRGEVYRRAAIGGVGQMLFFEERMAALGFRAALESREYAGSGFDILFERAAEAA